MDVSGWFVVFVAVIVAINAGLILWWYRKIRRHPTQVELDRWLQVFSQHSQLQLRVTSDSERRQSPEYCRFYDSLVGGILWPLTRHTKIQFRTIRNWRGITIVLSCQHVSICVFQIERGDIATPDDWARQIIEQLKQTSSPARPTAGDKEWNPSSTTF